MDASSQDIAVLRRLQTTDSELSCRRKAFRELPQPERIGMLQTKRAQLEKKVAQVAELKKETASKMSRIEDEEAALKKKEADIQRDLMECSGDYRLVQAKSKELESVANRLRLVCEKRSGLEEESAHIADIESRIEAVSSEVENAVAEASASWRQEGGALKEQITHLQQLRALLLEALSPQVADLYVKTAKRFEGVMLSELKGNRCGACRTQFDEGRLIELASQAPLSVCPACRRLLIIEQKDDARRGGAE